MRVNIVLPFAGVSGGLRVAATYARLLTARGHVVTVVSQPPYKLTGKQRLKRLLRGNPWPLPVPPSTPLLAELGARHIVLDRIRPVTAADLPDADITIATWWETAEWVAALPPEKGAQVYLMQGYEMFPNMPHARVAATYRSDLHKLAVSSYVRDEVITHHGARDVTLLPNAIDPDQFDAPARAKNTALTVGFVYTEMTTKNIDLTLSALQMAKAQLPHLRARAFGAYAPNDPTRLPDWIDLTINPPQDDIPTHYAACDLWLLTSEKEGFGLPILEAMACRTPVLSTPAGAAPDLIDGQNGQVLDPDSHAFATAIARFDAMSDAEWQHWSGAAYASARAQTWQVATDRLEQYLQDLVQAQQDQVQAQQGGKS